MLINRGIWQKASLWNSAFLALFCVFLAACPGPATAVAQAPPVSVEKGRAILEKGPFLINGIEVLGPNALPASQAFYTVDGTRVIVLAARGSLYYGGSPFPCDSAMMKELAAEGKQAFGGELFPGIHYFFIIPLGFKNPCAFIGGFAARSGFFWNGSPGQKDIPFPAVFEL